jgi:Fe-S-cluster formation regulator IscX/YfhJ
MEDNNYLEPDFDPNTLRVVDLRKILVKHQVPFPASAKKTTLIESFNDSIKTSSATLRAARDNVRSSSRGIVNVDNSGYTLPNHSEGEGLKKASDSCVA